MTCCRACCGRSRNTPEHVEKWLAAGEKLLRSPITGVVFAAIAPFLPLAGITSEQLAGMKARATNAEQREAMARKRAGQ